MGLNLNKSYKDEIMEVLEKLNALYPEVGSELYYNSPFQLLVATMLSAQATDKKVNEITPAIFARYATPYDFLTLSVGELEEKIKQINYYKTKARNIIKMCQTLVSEYGGQVPADRDELMKLAGVGRKTANVILSYAFGIPAIAVDTHVFRVANRIGMVDTGDVSETELEMEKKIPEEWWSRAHFGLVLHGRRVCDAKKPKCDICSLQEKCKFFNRTTKAKE
jgi:endonuclease III